MASWKMRKISRMEHILEMVEKEIQILDAQPTKLEMQDGIWKSMDTNLKKVLPILSNLFQWIRQYSYEAVIKASPLGTREQN